MVARTGYTGERGFELYAPAAVADAAFERADWTPAPLPVGLGARDTLRLEMGFALYGHELTTDINPLEAGLGWAVEVGRRLPGPATPSRAVQGDGPQQEAVRRRSCTDRGVPRQGYAVFAGDASLSASSPAGTSRRRSAPGSGLRSGPAR